MRTALVGALTLVLFLPSASPNNRKPAWEWTLEERIAVRTNAELARERVRADSRRPAARATANADERAALVDSFDGKTHPELFLPHEVFRSLITLAFLGHARHGQLFRQSLDPEVRRLGLPHDFWQRLETVSAVYIADSLAEGDLLNDFAQKAEASRQRVKEALEVKQADLCGSRADAIAAARREFGAAAFNRFLYEVIAPHKFHSETELPDPEILRWIERGCR